MTRTSAPPTINDSTVLCVLFDMDDVLPSELRAVLKLTLSRTDTLTAISLDDEEERVPIVRELIEAILFTRRFLPTYLLVLGATVLLWAVLKYLFAFRSSQRNYTARKKDEFVSSGTSSSSSTLRGTDSPPLKDQSLSETVPLLVEHQVQQYNQRGLTARLWHSILSFLTRQPRPVPALTATKNTLPSNDTSVVIILFLALNLFYLFFRLPLSAKHAFTIADRSGLLFVANLPVLYILAAKNNQPLGWITGWSYEGLNIFHRRLGEWMTIAALVHVIGMIIGFYQLLAPFGYSLGWYLTRFIIVFGIIAFVFYVTIYITSVGYFRQAFYELFLALHIFLQVAALAMLFFHHHDARPYVLAAVGIWTLDRGISRIASKTASFIATFEVAKDGETVLMYCEVPVHRRWWKVGMTAGWYAGQHVFLTVPGMGFKHRFQAHPFTIASPAPLRCVTQTSWPLQLTIRAQDGFSKELLEYAKLHQHARVTMDGPYSSSQVLHAVDSADRVCLVAGGSGIAVTYPFAWARKANFHTAQDIVHDRKIYIGGRKCFPEIAKRGQIFDESGFAHFWVRQDARHESWVTMLPRSVPTSSSETEPTTLVNSGESIDLITRRFDTRSETGLHQRPDIGTELDAWVRGDVKQNIEQQRRTCVVVSGPDGLVRDVQNSVAKLVMEGWNIQVHVEKFGW